jgi:hypothetical protein
MDIPDADPIDKSIEGELQLTTSGRGVTVLLRAKDAVVFRAAGGAFPAGCQATACRAAGKKLFCGIMPEARVAGAKMEPTRESDCYALVAVMRSLEAAP